MTITVMLCTTVYAQTNTFPSSGNVGIGTLNPGAKLELVAGTNQRVQIGAVSGFVQPFDMGAGGTFISFSRPDDGALAHAIYSYNSPGGLKNNLAIGSRSDIVLLSGSGGPGGQIERMRISENGNVGIGTTTPTYKLEAVTTGSSALRLQTSTSAVGNPQIDLYDAGRYQETVISSSDGSTVGTYLASYSNHPLMFGTNHSAAQVTLTTNGNIGVGTSTPSYKLEAVTTGTSALRLQTSASAVGNPQIDLYDAGRYQETVISSSDGSTVGTYLASYSNHPLMFGTNHSAAQVTLVSNGNLGIGTITPSEKLSVNGNIKTQKLIVTQTGWSDYVFNDDYKLRSLSEVAHFIKENKHLPDIPSAREVEEKGISVGDNQALLLKKIEELTLYMIELKKENEVLKTEMTTIKRKIRS